MSSSHDMIMIACRVVAQATATWSGTLRLALVMFASALAPIAVIVLLWVIR
jgi:hypothetical protein